MIKVLDYGMGNTASILNMIRKSGGEAELCAEPEQLACASAIVLPGVGAFDNGINKLKSSGLLEVLKEKVLKEKVPFLGVCLGMQLLFGKSEEGMQAGLGWLKGDVKKFNFPSDFHLKKLKIPHMGWNVVKPIGYNNLYVGMDDEVRFYFVHSYHVTCENESDILATTNYGYEFTCSVQRENIWGVQFHPEKSHQNRASQHKSANNAT